jgi:hypothetical protein
MRKFTYTAIRRSSAEETVPTLGIHSAASRTDTWILPGFPERPTSAAQLVRRHVHVNAKPLHGMPLASVDQAAIAKPLHVVAKRGDVVTNRIRASLSAMFAWGMREGLAPTTPT